MTLRRTAALLFVPIMLAVGTGTYLYLGSLKSKVVKEQAQRPTVTKPRFVLPGTMYLVQAGRLYKLSHGSFTEIGPSGDWSQPTLTPDHTQLIAVSRSAQSSDLYLLDLNGKVVKRLTKNNAKIIDANHWAYYPRVSRDGSSVMYSYDSPKAGFRVDFAIWTMPLNGTQSQARRRTDPYWYTGGDIGALPLSGTSIIYVKHSVDGSGLHAQLWFQDRPGAVGRALTAEADDCSQPSLSPDGAQVAMICSAGKQSTTLRVAAWNGSGLGPARTVLSGGLYASPTWSPDGKSLAYLAPAGGAGHFQLWWLPLPPAPAATAAGSAVAAVSPVASPTPSRSPALGVPVQVTQGVDLAATSAPAWY